VLLLACAAASAQKAVAPAAPEWTEQQIEQMIFQQDRNPDGARGRLAALLTLYVEDVDRACQLTEAQKQKLQLAGRGDIKRFFDRCEAIKQKYRGTRQDDQQVQQAFWQEIRPLQLTYQAAFFHPDSLLSKSLPHTLKPDQAARYAASTRDRRAYQHRALVELAVLSLEQRVPLRDAQRQELIPLLLKETKPPRKSGSYDYYFLIFQFARIPEEKWTPLLDAPQWKILSHQLAQFRQMEPQYRQAGLLEAESEDNDEADHKPVNPAP
jgi:hypothetical protein